MWHDVNLIHSPSSWPLEPSTPRGAVDWLSHFDLWGSLRGWSCEVISYCWGKGGDLLRLDLEVLVVRAKTNIGSDHNNLLANYLKKIYKLPVYCSPCTNVIVLYCHTFVCSVMRSCCAENFVTLSLSDFFLISHVHRYGWEDSWKAR